MSAFIGFDVLVPSPLFRVPYSSAWYVFPSSSSGTIILLSFRINYTVFARLLFGIVPFGGYVFARQLLIFGDFYFFDDVVPLLFILLFRGHYLFLRIGY